MHNEYPTKEKIKDASGSILIMGTFYALWVLLVAVSG